MTRTALILATAFLLTACGSSSTTSGGEQREPPAPVTGPLNPYDDPPDYQGDPFADFPVVSGIEVPDYSGVVYEEEILSGSHYTIQIAAATNEDTAESLVAVFSSRSSMPIFVDHIGGFWKVRVGAFATRSDADSMLESVSDLGYSDSWVTTREP